MNQIAYKYRIYPTKSQEHLFSQTFGCVRYVYNHFLEYRQKEYSENNKSINYVQTAKKLTELKTELEWLKSVSSVSLQQSLRNLDSAFSNFFNKRAKYPKFKNKHAKQSFRLVNSAFKIKNEQLYIAKSKEPLNIKWSRELDLEKINSITISKDSANRYFVSIQGEKNIPLKKVNENKIGIDLGLTHFYIDSNGNKINNPRIWEKYSKKLKVEQRRLSKKEFGSNNYQKQRLKIARVHAKNS